VPEPVDGVFQPSPGNFSNQPYLGGGKKVPYIVLPGKSSLSPRETAAGTVGQPHPAMIRGLPLTEETGVSTIAQVVTAKTEVGFLHIHPLCSTPTLSESVAAQLLQGGL
jgi:hypothetical protein